MKYLVIVQDKDKNLVQATINAKDALQAFIDASVYVFGMNDGKEVTDETGYSVLAVIGEHPLINLGVK